MSKFLCCMGPQTFCANFCTPKNFPTLTFCHYLNMFYKKKFFTLTNLCQCIYPHKNFPKLPFCHYLNKFFYRFLLSIFPLGDMFLKKISSSNLQFYFPSAFYSFIGHRLPQNVILGTKTTSWENF